MAEFAGHLSPSEWIPLWLEKEAARVLAAPKLNRLQELMAQEIEYRTDESYTNTQQDYLTISGPDEHMDFDLLPGHQMVVDELRELSCELGVPWFACPCCGCSFEQEELIHSAKQKAAAEAQRLTFVARTLRRRRAVN